MFSQKSSAPSLGGLSVQTSAPGGTLLPYGAFEKMGLKLKESNDDEEHSSESKFEAMLSLLDSDNSGNNTAQTSSAPSGSGFGNQFGSGTTSSQPQSSGPFGGAGAGTSQPQSGGLLGGLGSTTQQQQQTGGNLFGALGSGTTGGIGMQQQQPQKQTPSFPSLGGSQNQPQQQQQQQNKPLLGGLGQNNTSTPTLGSFGMNTQQQQPQQQPQQQQGPTLSLFGNQNTQQGQQGAGSTVVPGVKIDLSNLVPTTKFDSCSDELKKEIEAIDTAILNQIRMCNEVSDLLPSISTQGSSIPNDVEYVQGKLDTLQEALINDASEIEEARNVVQRDAAEAKLAFRALDTLLLPLQYQMTPGDRWFSSSQPTQSLSKHSLRSALGARHNMLALPEDAEADSSVTPAGGPTNLVEYFSQRADDMNDQVERYRQNLKEVEDHLHGVEHSLHHRINELASAKSKDGAGGSASKVSELASTLGDVETAILGVAGRLGSVKENVQEMTLGPLGTNGLGRTNGW